MNLKPNFECLNPQALRQVAICFKEQDLKKTIEASETKDHFNWKNYSLVLLGGIVTGIILDRHYK